MRVLWYENAEERAICVLAAKLAVVFSIVQPSFFAYERLLNIW